MIKKQVLLSDPVNVHSTTANTGPTCSWHPILVLSHCPSSLPTSPPLLPVVRASLQAAWAKQLLYFFLLQNWCSASQGSSSTNVTSSDKECTLYSQMKLSSSKSAFTKLTWKHPQNHPHCYHPRRRSMSSDFVKLTCRCHFVRARLPQMSAVTRPAIPSFPHHHHQD